MLFYEGGDELTYQDMEQLDDCSITFGMTCLIYDKPLQLHSGSYEERFWWLFTDRSIHDYVLTELCDYGHKVSSKTFSDMLLLYKYHPEM